MELGWRGWGCCSGPGDRWSVHALPTGPGPHPGTFCLEEALPCPGSGQRWRKERGQVTGLRRGGRVMLGNPLPGPGGRGTAGRECP